MAQKPMLRSEVYARALRASQIVPLCLSTDIFVLVESYWVVLVRNFVFKANIFRYTTLNTAPIWLTSTRKEAASFEIPEQNPEFGLT